ncbi:MAG: hypothetical protein V4793_02175 [Paraburkholderia tropica]|uniref:hypothetical protein n=1 Tax=Burkholderia gladioli TaxID=28095 RepID=UPI000A77E2F3|nr:hypothetical protein [Burkholderia gladioli]AYQ91806.1 hypothetical protein EDD84_31555 [Burkholderia gladioli]
MIGTDETTVTQQGSELSYLQILEANHAIQHWGDETHWLAVTRTVQRSSLFPLSACSCLGFLNSFYRLPALLRKIETSMKAEEIADRARNLGIKLQSAHMGWLLPTHYLLGREWLISMGMLRPEDAAHDTVYLLDFWRRFQLAWRRNDARLSSREYGHRAQILPDRTLEVFAADLHRCQPGDALHEAAHGFMATASQYCFVAACESRINLHNSGPYRIDDAQEMLVRDFMDLGEGGLPWLDEVAADVPYNNLTVTLATRGCHFDIVDDWGSFESTPEFTSDMITGVGLYTSDPLSDGFLPVGMASAETLTSVFLDLTERLKHAMTQLWIRLAEWSRDQLLDAGALIYNSAMRNLAHIAGVFEAEDWFAIDPRAERFRPLLNDEFAEGLLGELAGLISMPNQQASPFVMMQHANRPARMLTPLPCSLVQDKDYAGSTGKLRQGISHLAPKTDRYLTTRGVLSQADYNEAARMHKPASASTHFRYLCETWIAYHRDTPLADELYRHEQRHSRCLRDRGAFHVRDPRKASMDRMYTALHGLALKPHALPADIAALSGMSPDNALAALNAARDSARAVEVDGRFMLSPLARIALEIRYAGEYAEVRSNPEFIAHYESFERVNIQLKVLITDWQTVEIGGQRIANDHQDKQHDFAVIDRLCALHDRVDGILARLAHVLPRLDNHRSRLLAALEKVESGSVKWLSDAGIDSYHTVWFQLHEDLLRIVGRQRTE